MDDLERQTSLDHGRHPPEEKSELSRWLVEAELISIRFPRRRSDLRLEFWSNVENVLLEITFYQVAFLEIGNVGRVNIIDRVTWCDVEQPGQGGSERTARKVFSGWGLHLLSKVPDYHLQKLWREVDAGEIFLLEIEPVYGACTVIGARSFQTRTLEQS
ncbi:hypothetical protein EU803_11235 [Loktanella sp. IMCC34160]|uniref:hypothetical protein n=1 Tax=Loktanella sp. IMCC34160 TaxID=2510646 RepID=UPI00101D6DC1|nr:hypothetical protein [Loktanella sp. IMCC34160]RYG90575.1 hypothetical protein EU803_11235 [Loktanella sp. IMCC34160]